MKQEFPKLGATLYRQDYEWLLMDNEDLVRDIEAEVVGGADPEAIGRFIARELGDHRVGTISRCINAAKYLQSRVSAQRG